MREEDDDEDDAEGANVADGRLRASRAVDPSVLSAMTEVVVKERKW